MTPSNKTRSPHHNKIRILDRMYRFSTVTSARRSDCSPATLDPAVNARWPLNARRTCSPSAVLHDEFPLRRARITPRPP